MLIVSKFRDYYDSVNTHGVDKSIVYFRNNEEIEDVKTSLVLPDVVIKAVEKLVHSYLRPQIVYVCGRFIPCITSYDGKTHFFYNAEDVINHYKDNLNNQIGFMFRVLHGNKSGLVGKLFNFFEVVNNALIDDSYFYDQKIVTAVIRNFKSEYNLHGRYNNTCTIELNPDLSVRSFYKIIDPYTIHQEIMMYISGVLGSPAGEMIQISDKDKVVSKGFDPIYGFRTRKVK